MLYAPSVAFHFTQIANLLGMFAEDEPSFADLGRGNRAFMKPICWAR